MSDDEAEMVAYLTAALYKYAEDAVEKDHVNHFEITQKKKKVDKKFWDMLEYIAEHAARNC